MLEVGAVIEDWKTPVEHLPRFHCYVVHDRLQGEAYAFSMHAVILRRIAKQEAPYLYLKPHEVTRYLSDFLMAHGHDPMKMTAGGKNFASFDLNFLRLLPNYTTILRFKHRHADPAALYWNPETDDALPDMKTCLERAGIKEEVLHTAVEDAQQVIKLLRHKLGKRDTFTHETLKTLIEKAKGQPMPFKPVFINPPSTPLGSTYDERQSRRNQFSSLV